MNVYKKLAVGAALAVFSLLIFIVVTKQQAQDKFAIQKDDATQIQLGEMTEQQKKHSKLYTRSEESDGKDLLSFGKDINVILTAPWGEAYSEGEPKPSQNIFIQKLACDSDAIVQARVLSKVSQMTENHRFVFTDYALELTSVNKTLLEPKLEPGTKIILTAPGGAVKVDGKVIDVKVKANKRLVAGDSYLFFLEHLKDSDSFKTINEEGIFAAGSEMARFNDTNPPYQIVKESKVSFINSIVTATQMCQEKGK
jgi:hypothetical protein